MSRPETPSRRASDMETLRSARKAANFPFSKKPFVDHHVKSEDPEDELQPGELRVKAPEEVPWIDLLLEISMTTAFASLTDGTPVLHWVNAVSFIAFFLFVWWIWVSQVAYNMRFRQADWLHRGWVFVQLVVFSSIAAFTRDFDITNGLFPEDSDADEKAALWAQLGRDTTSDGAFDYPNDRLPRINARGLSIVLGFSRLVLLAQYIVVYYHGRGRKRSSLLVHMLPLVFSSFCYFGAFFVIGSEAANNYTTPNKVTSVAKVILWYLPIAVEMASHFFALSWPGFVKYSTESVYARSAVIFIVILGGGLDKITGGFQDFVGLTGFGSNGIPLLVSTAAIFIAFFSLYFGTPDNTRKLWDRRALSWLFSQGIFLSALILTLRAIATSLQFANLVDAVGNNVDALAPIFKFMEDQPGSQLNGSDFKRSKYLYDKMGLGFDDVVGDVNQAIVYAAQNHITDMSGFQRQETMAILYYILGTVDAKPDEGSLLEAKFLLFLTSPWNDTAIVSTEKGFELWSQVILERGSSIMWLFPSAGCTVLALVIMSLIKGLPRDRWEWGVITLRSCVGLALSLLALLDIGAPKKPLDDDGTASDSKIWILTLGTTQWPLIILASVLVAVRIIEQLIAYGANRAYHSFEHMDIWTNNTRPAPTQQHQIRPLYRYNRADSDGDMDDTVKLTPYNYSERKGSDSGYSDPYDAESYRELDSSETIVEGRRRN